MSSASPIAWESWQAEVHATLMFVVHDGHILLIEKKRGFGRGKVNGPGGKIDPGETPLECAVRETREEVCLEVGQATKVGELHFAMSDDPDILCHVFVTRDFRGRPSETDEARPFWCRLDQIPYDRMWRDDRFWIPLMLQGRSFLGRFVFHGEEVGWYEIKTDVVWP